MRLNSNISPDEPNYAAARQKVGQLLGVTFDCIYGKSRAGIVKDLDSRHIGVGGATADDLVGAALTAAGIGERECLEGEAVATQLMTVVLHDMAGKTNLLVAVIPLNGETGELIANLTLRLWELLFAHSLHLVFGGGGGAKEILKAWDLVKAKSHGTKWTGHADIKLPSDLPFVCGSDIKEHDPKGMKRDSFYSDILIDKAMARLDDCIVHLRGVIPQPAGRPNSVVN